MTGNFWEMRRESGKRRLSRKSSIACSMPSPVALVLFCTTELFVVKLKLMSIELLYRKCMAARHAVSWMRGHWLR